MRLKILLPVLMVSIAVGFIVIYRDLSLANEVEQATAAIEELSVSAGSEPTVPGDICYTDKIDSVVFSHQKHAIELGFECTTCHSDIFQMDAYTVAQKEDFDMSGINDGKYCGTCHSSESQVAFSADSECARCHRGVKGAERMEANNNGHEG